MIAYVDGSYNPEVNRYGSGVLLLTDDGSEYKRLSIGGNSDGWVEMRNVAGEVIAAMTAVKEAIQAGESRIKIIHDYKGIAAWVSGDWKCKNTYTQSYTYFMRKCQPKIQITFQNIRGHIGDKYHDVADKLAKEGVYV